MPCVVGARTHIHTHINTTQVNLTKQQCTWDMCSLIIKSSNTPHSIPPRIFGNMQRHSLASPAPQLHLILLSTLCHCRPCDCMRIHEATSTHTQKKRALCSLSVGRSVVFGAGCGSMVQSRRHERVCYYGKYAHGHARTAHTAAKRNQIFIR